MEAEERISVSKRRLRRDAGVVKETEVCYERDAEIKSRARVKVGRDEARYVAGPCGRFVRSLGHGSGINRKGSR